MLLSKLVLGAQKRNQKKREHLMNKLLRFLNRNLVRGDDLDNDAEDLFIELQSFAGNVVG